MEKLNDVGWCERCLRPFDRPKPGPRPGSGWRVCDDCKIHSSRTGRIRRKPRKGGKETSALNS